jgi:hypothetical protein
MPLDFYAHAVVMVGNISASQVTLNCSHMSVDVYNQNSPRFSNIQGCIEKASEYCTLEGNMQYFLKTLVFGFNSKY